LITTIKIWFPRFYTFQSILMLRDCLIICHPSTSLTPLSNQWTHYVVKLSYNYGVYEVSECHIRRLTGKASDLFSSGAWFESQSRHLLSWAKYWAVVGKFQDGNVKQATFKSIRIFSIQLFTGMMHHGTCRIRSSEIFKSYQLKRKSTDSAHNTETASTHIPTTSRYHQITGDWYDIYPSICPPDFMSKCSLVTLVFKC
jgi:hypothetical protein